MPDRLREGVQRLNLTECERWTLLPLTTGVIRRRDHQRRTPVTGDLVRADLHHIQRALIGLINVNGQEFAARGAPVVIYTKRPIPNRSPTKLGADNEVFGSELGLTKQELEE